MLSPLHTNPALRPDHLKPLTDADRAAEAMLTERRALWITRIAQSAASRIVRWVSSPA